MQPPPHHHHPPPHPPCLSCRRGQSPASPVGQLAAPRPLRLTFLQMTFFNLYNPGKADCAQVPPAVTSMRHFPPARRWSGVSCVSGADLFDFVCFLFFFSFWRRSSQNKTNNLCLSESCCFSHNHLIFFSCLHSSWYTALPLTDAAALLSNGLLQETAGASRLRLLTVCVFTLLVFSFYFFFLFFGSMRRHRRRIFLRHHTIADDSVFF